MFSFKGSIGEFLIFPVETPDFQLRDWMISMLRGNMATDQEKGMEDEGEKEPLKTTSQGRRRDPA